MKILHILGNGFDLNLGLKTKYSDFYKHYTKSASTDSEVIKKLKVNMQGDIETWSDLELRLGQYTSEINTEADAEKIIFDMLNSLCDYLKQEQNRLDLSKVNCQQLFIDLIEPEIYLTPRDLGEVAKRLERRRNDPRSQLQLLTFNYTTVLEKIIGDAAVDTEVGKKFGKSVKLSDIEHIHGYLDERPILGVNEVEQIGNEKFRHSREMTELFVKPMHNRELGHTRDDYCMSQISQANLISIFGSSIGETDKLWWEAIGRRLGEECLLIIFQRGPALDGRRQILGARSKRELIDRFLSMTKLDEKMKEHARSFIYVGVNTKVFDLDKNTNRKSSGSK